MHRVEVFQEDVLVTFPRISVLSLLPVQAHRSSFFHFIQREWVDFYLVVQLTEELRREVLILVSVLRVLNEVGTRHFPLHRDIVYVRV